MNMSKFVAEDVPLFLSLIDDLFPALKADRASFPEISAALEKVRTASFTGNLYMLLQPAFCTHCIKLISTATPALMVLHTQPTRTFRPACSPFISKLSLDVLLALMSQFFHVW